MFDSGISTKAFIENIRSEVDVALPISDETYLAWINAVEQFIYGSIVKEEGIYTFAGDVLDLPITVNAVGEAILEAQDITAVYAVLSSAQRVQLMHVSAANSVTFGDVYYFLCGSLYTRVSFPHDNTDVVYYRKPVIKTKDNYAAETIKLPVEFMELISSKIRGEAYKLANEDSIAAKWLNDYNAHLQDFGAWCASKIADIGM